MLGLDPRAAKATWTVVVVLLALALVYLARNTLFVFTLAIFFAYMLAPVVHFIDCRLSGGRLPRGAVLALTYLLLVAVLAGIGFLVGSVVSDQAANLAENLPKLVQQRDPLQSIWLPHWLEPLRARILEAIRAQLGTWDSHAFPILRKAVTELLTHVEIVLFLVLIPILGFFFLKEGKRLKDAVLVWTSEGSARLKFDEILADVHVLLGSYIRALVLLASATFVAYSVVLALLGAGYAVLLALVAAMLEFIPVIGPLTASVVIVLVAGFTGSGHLVLIIVFLLVYRMFQDYVLSPYLMGSGVELHPLLVLFGVLAGEQIGGIPGMFLSVPVIATLRVVYVRIQRGSRQRELESEPVQ